MTSIALSIEAMRKKPKPFQLLTVEKGYQLHPGNWFSLSNPKVAKNGAVHGIPTFVWHGLPHRHGACPAAGSCSKLCLNKAGNPAALNSKISCRIRRSDVLHWQRNDALAYMAWQILAFAGKHWSHPVIGGRLNGTTDHAWETFTHSPDQSTLDFIESTTGFRLQPETGMFLYDLLNAKHYSGPRLNHKLRLYDYTKRIDRDMILCRGLGYHLTASHGSKLDTWDFALREGLNYAAAFDIRRGQPLPETVTYRGHTCRVLDGDKSDWRPFDPAPTDGAPNIIGLRIKRTPGQKPEHRQAFCLPVTSSGVE